MRLLSAQNLESTLYQVFEKVPFEHAFIYPPMTSPEVIADWSLSFQILILHHVPEAES